MVGAAILCGFFCRTPAAGQTIRVEAEWMTDFLDLGGLYILPVTCGYASNAGAVDYIDRTGEWIQLAVNLPENGYYETRLCSEGLEDSVSVVRLTLFTDESLRVSQSSDFQTLGDGIK